MKMNYRLLLWMIQMWWVLLRSYNQITLRIDLLWSCRLKKKIKSAGKGSYAVVPQFHSNSFRSDWVWKYCWNVAHQIILLWLWTKRKYVSFADCTEVYSLFSLFIPVGQRFNHGSELWRKPSVGTDRPGKLRSMTSMHISIAI